jgi:dipeptidyl-peptidase-3
MLFKPSVMLMAVLMAAGCSSGVDSSGNSEEGNGSPAAAPTATTERPYLLEQVDDAAVVQLYADGFSSLPLREKTLVYHLYNAALAGRDIFIDQKHRSALEMRGVIEQIIAHPQGVDPASLREIQRYTKLFWINNGQYNNLTARKFVLNLTPQAFAAAVKAAAAAGATFTPPPGESLDAMLTRLGPMFFDPNVDPIVTNKTPGAWLTSKGSPRSTG